MSKIQDHLKQIYGVKVSHVAILKWIRKYSVIFKEFTDKIRIDGSGKLHADEMMVNINGKWHWFWNTIDHDTRFVTSTHLSKVREIDDAKKLFYASKDRLNTMPKELVTDGLPAYIKASRKVFGWNNTKHKQLIKFSDKINNNLIERFNGTTRERTKIMRGFHEFNSTRDILDLFVMHYNFLRPHISLNGMTPAQAAGVNLHLNGGNRWLELLKATENSEQFVSQEKEGRKLYIIQILDKEGKEVTYHGLTVMFVNYQKAVDSLEHYRKDFGDMGYVFELKVSMLN